MEDLEVQENSDMSNRVQPIVYINVKRKKSILYAI